MAVAVFALPANHPLHRCEPLRPEVEAALAGYFDRLVPMRLAIDEGQIARPPDQLAGSTNTVDPSRAGVGRARPIRHRPSSSWPKAFPGAEIVEDERAAHERGGLQ